MYSSTCVYYGTNTRNRLGTNTDLKLYFIAGIVLYNTYYIRSEVCETCKPYAESSVYTLVFVLNCAIYYIPFI